MDEPPIDQLADALGWTQSAMAQFLDVSQPTVGRYARGTPSGPSARLLTALAKGLAAGTVRAGMSPADALTALGLDSASPFRPAGEAADA